MSRDSVVSIATRYGLDGLGIESSSPNPLFSRLLLVQAEEQLALTYVFFKYINYPSDYSFTGLLAFLI